MSNAYSSEATASTSQIPTFTGGSAHSFAARARAKAARDAQSRLAPPPGLSAPTTPASSSRGLGRSGVASPSFYGVHDGRARMHGGNKILLPVAPELAPSATILSPSTPSPIPRTPSPPPMVQSSPFYQQSLPNSNSSKTTVNEAASYPLPISTAPSTTNSSTTEKRPKNVIRKKSTAQASASKAAMRTGSTTSTNASSTSFTTSTSTSHMDRGYGQSTSVFGVSMPPTSYTYGSRNISGSGSRQVPRTIAPPPGLSGIPTPGTMMQRTRSGSGSQPNGTSARLSVSGIDAHISGPKTGSIPPPLTIPAAAAENYNSSPSTAKSGSPGMFSYTSTPTSSSTNPSLLQSPGFSPPVQRVRNSSPTRPLISKYAGVTAATDKLGKVLDTKRKDSIGNTSEPPKQIKPPSRNSLLPTNSSTVSLAIPKTRDAKAPSPENTSKMVQPSKHARKSSRDLLLSKSALTAGLTGLHFRRPSNDHTTPSAPPSQIARPSHSRQSSRDSSNVRSPGETSSTSGGYFSSMTSPIPIPVPSASSSSLRAPPSRPSRAGAPDDPEGFAPEVPVIQSGIVASKDSKAKGQKMKIVTSSSLPQRAGMPFGNVNGSTSSVNLASTSVPGKPKPIRVPTPTSATGATVVHGFASATSSSTSSQPSKPSDNSPRKLRKEDRKNSIDKTTTPPPRPSLFSRTRTKTAPGPAATITTEKEKTALPRRPPGPAAGTGHEGYSQFTKSTRNRSSSGSAIPTAPAKPQSSGSTPSGSWGRTAGANALKSSEMDVFLSNRLEPVVIKGGVAAPTGGADMVRTSSSQSASSYLQRPSIKGDSQKSSLDLARTESSQGPSSRDPSLDVNRKVPNEFDQFHFPFDTDLTSQRRPSLVVDTSKLQARGEPPTTSILSPPPKGLPGKPIKPPTIKSEDKESKLRATKKLAPPPVTNVPQPTKMRWNIFSARSAPDVSKTSSKTGSKAKGAPSKTAPQSPVSTQDVRFGNEEEGGFIRDVHSPPATAKSVQEMSRLASSQKQRVESVLLPEPPVMPRLLASRTPSPVTAVQLSSPGLPVPKATVTSRSPSPGGLIRPPPGLPIPPGLRPKISVTSSTPKQATRPAIIPDIANASPVSAIAPSPASAITKSVSPQHKFTRPSPAALPSRNIQELAEKDQTASLTRIYDDDDDESDEYTDEEDYIDDEQDQKNTKKADTAPLVENLTATPVVSPPVTPKSLTPEPNANPSPGRRQRLGTFAIGRIPKAANVEATTIKLPTLADILPPPPSMRAHQPQQGIKIHPPRRTAPPPTEPVQSASSEGEDDSGEGADYINTRKIPLNRLAPLVTSGWSQVQPSKRISEHSDEWQEYDDFLDEMSGTTPRSKTPSLGPPFPDTGIFKPDVQDERVPTRRLKDSPTLPSVATFGAVTTFAPSNKKKLVLDQGKLAFGRPLAARPLFSPALPTARSSLFGIGLKELNSQRSSSTYSQRSSGNQKTIAFADFISAYAEVDRGVMSVVDPLGDSKHTSSTARKMGLLSPMSSVTDFEDTDSSDSDSYRQSIISAMPGTEDALEGEMKVRLWALMTSRWLSFGRVLVSPAHEEIRNAGPTGSRILVVDGLGNDDWSFYCSLNYLNAKVYNLTPSQATYPMSPAGGKSAAPNSPGDNLSNHYQIHHASFASPFPFPSGFFSVVTFRFLPATSDALWPFIISQCMRVLKPGGYLELSVLDIDMVNMGPRTKRTIEEIKLNLRKHQAGNGSDWFKKTPSEKALRLLAKRGFTDITRCRVGLPTVGNVDGSREEQASMQQILKEGNSPDEVDMSSAEGINRVVSKVGRWWYTKCFENIGEGQGDQSKYQRSLWEDKTLLRECEKKKTNFRMLISFAKKPSDWKD
ncbi:hypothetical protein ABW19_dt0209262 [Dactylella cylindrospora]|nr:hypothetical protein ABW19_dt0209262 [Dactylella cylindrospora]